MNGLSALELTTLLHLKEVSYYDLRVGDIVVHDKAVFWIAVIDAENGDYRLTTSDGYELRGPIKPGKAHKFVIVARPSLNQENRPTIRYRGTEKQHDHDVARDIPDDLMLFR